jgi:segregation and condensation protein B
MYGTTRQFLDYFSLKTLDELPSLAELRDLNEIGRELELDLSDIPGLQVESADAAGEAAEAAADDSEESLPRPEAAAGESSATIH